MINIIYFFENTFSIVITKWLIYMKKQQTKDHKKNEKEIGGIRSLQLIYKKNIFSLIKKKIIIPPIFQPISKHNQS